MGQCKSFPNIPRLYRFQALDHIAFGYIQGLRKALPSMNVRDAVAEFQRAFGIDDEQYCLEAIRATYYRILGAMVDIKDNADDIIL